MAKRNHFKSAAQKSYRSRNQNNPYFRKKRKVPLKPIIAATGCFVFVLVGIVFLLSNNRFKIQHVDVSGIEYIDVIELENVVAKYLESSSFLVWKKSNIFLFDPIEQKRLLFFYLFSVLY